MRVVFRADASVSQGSGHVMRCLTLAEPFAARGDEVVFVGAIDSIPWLGEYLASAGYRVEPTEAHTLSVSSIVALAPDWVVIDSYVIPAPAVSALAERLPVLAIVDGDHRDIEATLYVDQNLGAGLIAGHESRSLAGSSYALIRDAVLDARRPQPWSIRGVPRLTAFMGGTDPTGVIVEIAEQISVVDELLDVVVVCPTLYHPAVRRTLGAAATIIAPTPDLPAILAESDLVISASGTSAWDICTLGIPAVLVGVVDNQSAGLSQATSKGLALGVDLVTGGSFDEIAPALRTLLRDAELRERLSTASTEAFDGLGKLRVVDAMLATLEE